MQTVLQFDHFRLSKAFLGNNMKHLYLFNPQATMSDPLKIKFYSFTVQCITMLRQAVNCGRNGEKKPHKTPQGMPDCSESKESSSNIHTN